MLQGNGWKVRYKYPSQYVKLIVTNLPRSMLSTGVSKTRYEIVHTLFKR